MIKFFLSILFFPAILSAQYNIKGKIVDENDKPVYRANIFAEELQTGTTTNFSGNFELASTGKKKIDLKISFVGYKTKNVIVDLPQEEELIIKLEIDPVKTDEIVVTESREGVYLKNSPVKIKVITEKQIKKNYAIDLTQVFQHTPGIKVQQNCGVCATTDLRIQGLEGQYSQILINGRPVISNLGSVYGLMGINASNIKQIEIVKGPGTILYGPEAVSGTINIILKDPADLPGYSYSMEGTTHLEHSFSLTAVEKWENSAVSFTADYSGNYNRIDENKDGYTDVPVFERYSFINQWMFDISKKSSVSLMGRYSYEDRFGGQLNWERKLHRGSEISYGESIFTNRGEFFGGYLNKISNDAELQSNFSVVYHNQNSYYGSTLYDAEQFTSYTDFLSILKLNDKNSLTLGTAFKQDYYDDNSSATFDEALNINAPSNFYIASLFVQNELKLKDDLTTLLGLRYNYHNIQRSIFQPRASIKYSPWALADFRISFGTGFRTVNLFTEDHAAYTGAREVVIAEALNPEKSINTTISYLQNIDFTTQFIKLEISGHYTHFSNQIIPDYDTDPQKIIYANLSGYSISQGIEASIDYENFIFPVKLFASYEFLEAFKIEEDLRDEIEYNPKHVVNLQLDYIFKNVNMEMNITGKIVGKQYLPEIKLSVPRPAISQSYSLWNINFKKSFGNIRFSLGMSNIFNYMQDSPLIDPQNPFGDYFDTVYIYAPLHGRELTAGVKFNIY